MNGRHHSVRPNAEIVRDPITARKTGGRETYAKEKSWKGRNNDFQASTLHFATPFVQLTIRE